MQILNGKIVNGEIQTRLKKEVESFKKKPCLCIIQVGDRVESNAYIDAKRKFGEAIGVTVSHKKYDENISTELVVKEIKKLNADKKITGILVQLPLPESLDQEAILNAILPEKDVDGLSAANIKKIWDGLDDAFVPATAKGILTLLHHYKISVEGKRALIIGRSSLVGKPTAISLLHKNATVTIAHSKTKNLKELAKEADIIVIAIGKPKFLTRDYLSSAKDQVVIDVGINSSVKNSQEKTTFALENEIPGKTLIGDVDFEDVKDLVYALSPVPGGVGPMTVASLFENVVLAHQKQWRG